MLAGVEEDGDWQNVRRHVVSRMSELKRLNISALARDSKATDPTGEGVSDATWRELRRGEPVRRLDKRQLVCQMLEWRDDAFDLMLAGDEPVVSEGTGGSPTVVVRLENYEARLMRLESQVRELTRLLGEAQNGGGSGPRTTEES